MKITIDLPDDFDPVGLLTLSAENLKWAGCRVQPVGLDMLADKFRIAMKESKYGK